MDAAYHAPLVDCFRRGEVSREVRMLAAEGVVAPRAHEQAALLMFLVDDADPEIAAAAEATIGRIPREVLAAFLARADVTPEVREFFVGRGVAPGPVAAELSDAPLLQQEPSAAQPAEPAPADDTPAVDSVRKGTAQRLALMSVAERMKVAMHGTREERGVLIRDPNRLVSSAVLSSPKLTESEVEAIARMTNVSDDVLRTVGSARAWTKNYNIVASLTRNAKTPVAVSLTLLNRLVERDIKMLASDRNIPEPIRMQARRMAAKGQARRE